MLENIVQILNYFNILNYLNKKIYTILYNSIQSILYLKEKKIIAR